MKAALHKNALQIYSWATPNGHKVHILLHELGLKPQKDFVLHPIDIGAGDQFQPDFLAISPNNKIPAMVDPIGPDGKPISVFESGAILVYLAAKFNRFMPKTTRQRYDMLQWLMFQMGGLGPMLGQAHHFRIYAPEPITYAVDRYTNEAKRLYKVVDHRLGQSAYVGGAMYSIADMAVLPWIHSWEKQGVQLTNYPNLAKWYKTLMKRPAVIQGLQCLTELRAPLVTPEARKHLFATSNTEVVK